MNYHLPSPWTIIKAKTIIDHLPDNLPALQILHRSVVGPAIRVCAVGDIGLSGRVAVSSKRRESSPFYEVESVLRMAEITFCNLESPLAGDLAPGQMFAAPLSGATVLSDAGFNLIHLANNHIYDYGREGLAATMNAVSEAGMTALGAAQDLITSKKLKTTSINGLRTGWLGCGRTLIDQHEDGPNFWEFEEKDLLSAVKTVRSSVDVLIVSIHIGLMYIDYPRPEHKMMAEKLMSAGADLILMHHAHVLQGVQLTGQGNVCCYNLGNFLFDWHEGNVKVAKIVREQNEGAIFLFTLDQRGVSQAMALPTWIEDGCKVRWATGMQGEEILNRLTRISRDLEGDFVPAFERQRAERNTGPIFKVLLFHVGHGNWNFIRENVRKIRPEHLLMCMRWFKGACSRFVKGMMS